MLRTDKNICLVKQLFGPMNSGVHGDGVRRFSSEVAEVLVSPWLQSLKRCGKLQLWSPHGDLLGIMYMKTEVRFAASD